MAKLLLAFFLDLLEPVRALAALIAALESLDTSGGVNELALAGEERMAGGTQINLHPFHRTAGLETVPAGAGHRDALEIFRMYVLFHVKKPRKLFNAQSVILP